MAKYRAFGTQLQVSDMAASNPQFTTVAQLTSVGDVGGDTDEEDVTTHDSAGGSREMIPTFSDPGEVPFEGIYDPANATHDTDTGLAALYASKEIVDWKLVLPTTPSSYLAFSGWLKTFKIQSLGIDGAVKFSGSIRLTGDIDFPA